MTIHNQVQKDNNFYQNYKNLFLNAIYLYLKNNKRKSFKARDIANYFEITPQITCHCLIQLVEQKRIKDFKGKDNVLRFYYWQLKEIMVV